MMRPTLETLFKPLTAAELDNIPLIVGRLFQNEDFQVLYRYFDQQSGGILKPAFFADSADSAELRAAWREGSKVVPRELFGHFVNNFTKPEEQNFTQTTET